MELEASFVDLSELYPTDEPDSANGIGCGHNCTGGTCGFVCDGMECGNDCPGMGCGSSCVGQVSCGGVC